MTNQMMLLKAQWLLLAFFLGGLSAYGQSPGVANHSSYQPPVFTDSARMRKIAAAFPVIEKMYLEYAEQHHFPGFVFGVVVDGELVHSGQHGYTNIDRKTPVTNRSIFRIASMTKSFTAMAILQLRDAGKLRLDDSVHSYVPALKNATYLTQDAPVITIRHLLTHAAGFPEDNPWGDRQLADTDAEFTELLEGGISFSNVPGVAYEYSNLGFTLLGTIITEVSGQPYQQYICENILKPLGMDNTYWEYTEVPTEQLAQGYRWAALRRAKEGWQEEPLLPDGAFGAMGGLWTSLEDFSRYMALHQAAWPPRDEGDQKVLKRSSLREMQQPQRISYFNPEYQYPSGEECGIMAGYNAGLGWIKDCKSRVRVGHTGGLPGFGSNWLILPDYGIGLVCLANLTYAPTSAINVAVMDTLFALADPQPRELPVSPILEQRKQELLEVLPDWPEAKTSGLFAENFFLDTPRDSLRKETQRAFQKIGKIVNVHALQAENQLRGSFVIEGATGKAEVFFTLTPQRVPLIQAFGISQIE